MTPADEPLLATIRTIIEGVVGADRTPLGVGHETRLADGFWMDSVELLEVIVACEHAFGITFDEASEMEWSGLVTLGDLAELIRARQSAARAGP